jgi:BspA type Leucine rich repeat region (6 copies)/Domain of unknown function (DUF6383)
MKKLYSTLLLALFVYTTVAQVTKTANVTTAGTLSTVASAYLSTVTNLTITGSIDARDIKCMRDQMPLLAVLDMSGVSIQAYSGTDGTSYSPYLANEMPGNSFCNNEFNQTLKSIILPNSVTSLAYGAFGGCSGLTSILLPNSLKTIASKAFLGCTGFSSILIPKTVTNAASSCILDYNIQSIVAPAGFFNTYTGYMNGKPLSLLQSIKINSDTLKQTGLDIINNYRSNLKVLDMADAQNIELIPDMLYNYYPLQSLILPKNLKTVSYHSISDCFSLTSVNIPASVTSIEMRAFENGRSIKKVTFETGSQLKTIGNWAFYSCHALDTLTIPVGVTSIGNGAFWGCDYLKNVTIPSSVKSIGDTGFEGCKAMKIMHVAAVVPPALQTNTFNEVDKSIPVIVPVGSLSAYQTAPVWKEFINLRTTDITELNQLQETSYNIYAKGRSIVVDNAANMNIRIFDLSGRKLTETIQAAQNETLNMPATGVYLVQIGSKNTKVMVY